jgi:hypothetical protein
MASNISIAAIHALFTDKDDLVGDYMDDLSHRGEALATALSPHGTGRMESTIRSGTDHDPFTGEIRAWWGAGYNAEIPFGRPWKAGFPVINALEASHGYVWNRSPRDQRHVRGVRRTHPFLTESLDVLANEEV